MSRPEMSPLRIGAAVLTAMVCAGALLAGLTALATPADYQPRLAALAQRVVELERLSKAPGSTGEFGPHAVCPTLDPTAVAAVRSEILAAAEAGGVKVTYLATDPPPNLDAGGRIAPLGVQLSAQGQYDALSAFVDRLAAAQPVLFVDRLDLAMAKADVVLKLSGKVFCWKSARS